MKPNPAAPFLEKFVLPLVAGGDLHIGPPISLPQLDLLEQALPHASEALVAIDEARTEVLADLVVRPPALVLGMDELALAAGLHNLLFLAHPAVERWSVRDAAIGRVRETAARMVAQPPATDRLVLLARHALLHNLYDITRTDTRLTWWTGRATFLGTRPPNRLTRWRVVRRVREETSLATYADLFGDPHGAPIVLELVRRSPLTELLGQHGPPIYWPLAVPVLRDPELCRAVAYRALRGGEPDGLVAGPARFAAAFEAMLDQKVTAADVRAVTAFLVHLNVLLAVGETRERDLDAPSALLAAVLAPERAERRPRGLATFFATPDAAVRTDPRLAHPPGLAEDPALRRRWHRHREQVRAAVGEPVVAALAARLARHLGAG